MKKVIGNDEFRKYLLEATNLICDAVTQTLGPKGNNVLINNDDASPFITNDGVTIASSIASDDEIINTLLDIIKESSLKTNEEVGDGTTTTLVLLQVLITEGIKLIESGLNATILKKELLDTSKKVISLINSYSKKPTKKELEAVAIVSANDKEIGIFVSKLFYMFKNISAIKLDYSHTGNTYYEINNGYSIDIDNIPSIYFENEKVINLFNSKILIIIGYLDSLEKISSILNEIIKRNMNLIILVDDYDNNVLENIILYKLQYHLNIYLFKLSDYASRKDDITKDISILSESAIRNINYEDITWNDLGNINVVNIEKDKIILINKNKEIKKYIKKLKNELKKTFDTYEKDFLNERIAKLGSGFATIFVGGSTDTEIKEKIMRYTDSLSSLEIAQKGVVLGEGITFFKISNELESSTYGDKIIKKALEMPFSKIMANALKDSSSLKQEIINSNFNLMYDLENDTFINADNSLIIDSSLVEITAFKNAISIATLLLTSNYLVINEAVKNNTFEY